MVDVQVEYEYISQEDDELSLKPGDIVTDVNKMDGGWWEGTLNGKRGMFPDNFVKEIVKKEKEKPKAPAPATKKSSPPAGGNVAELASRLAGVKLGQQAPTKRTSLTNGVKKVYAKVTYAYSPLHEDELKLDVGTVVEITKQEEEGWWEGLINGKAGVFPSNFVELIEENSSEEKDSGSKDVPKDSHLKDTNIPEGEVHEIKGRRVVGVGLGNIFQGQQIKLRTAISKDEDTKKDPAPAKKAPVLTPTAEPPALPPKDIKEPKPVERAKVLFSYDAENDDELTLEEGVIITVLEKELEDSGWWKGEVNGKVGVFPDNFVTIIAHEDRPKKPPPPQVPENRRGRPVSQISTDKPDPVRTAPKREEPKEEAKGIRRKAAQTPPPKKGNKADPKLIAQTDDMKAQEQGPEDQDGSFGGTESADPKLTHPTAGRVKPPVRRPPGGRKGEEREDKKEMPPPPRAARPPPPTPTREDPPIASPVLTPRSQDSNRDTPQDSAVDSAVVEELHKEIKFLRANTVHRDDFSAIQKDLKHMREDMDKLRATFNRKLLELMKEVDEEKKTRLNMQVEIDRLRKLVVPDDDL